MVYPKIRTRLQINFPITMSVMIGGIGSISYLELSPSSVPTKMQCGSVFVPIRLHFETDFRKRMALPLGGLAAVIATITCSFW